MSQRTKCIELLNELSTLESHQYKSRAYSRAAINLGYVEDQDFLDRDDFTDIEGIGEGINEKILEFKESGIITKLQTLRAESCDYLDPERYKIRQSYITKKITYKEANEYVLDLYKNLTEKLNIKFQVAGSYRRHKSYIGDIDIIVLDSDYEQCLDYLSKFEVISSGDYKSSYLIDPINKIQLDIIGVPKNEYPFHLLYLTGSKEFNIQMRYKAKQLGFKLNQNGLWMNESSVSRIKTERDIFKVLGMEYVEPDKR